MQRTICIDAAIIHVHGSSHDVDLKFVYFLCLFAWQHTSHESVFNVTRQNGKL